ncbi:MAG TPA: 16S rRNA (guanine(527)-N(7))-methyltransferase RsmG [Candidatus Limivivens intestinipullorum]|uniref:Ribosomal RNA small subunit methyltransferase G n=1 Tax=Candidatus Limivivens intestinipullorum TaxID=2840858 RepID=A0A9D1ETP6_9FIRM|nr:16S rRNA (guanine(527)-N(7))-methyltransferase RsmG [Candidatus Limivivens intestinipullorum]
MKEAFRILEEGCRALGISLSDKQTARFAQYYDLLIEWNSFMNLTGITELSEVLRKHFVDSLALVKFMEPRKGCRILDVGTGAGFPGIPLKIAFPETEVVLLDSLNKRIKFLDNLIEKLELSNTLTIHGRAEDFARDKEYREAFDLVVSRAVANLALLAEYCVPYVKLGGYFVSYKSGDVDNEAKEGEKAVMAMGGRIEKIIPFTLPDSDIERSLVVIRKTESTPKRFPRKAGIPAKEPIK